MFYRGKLGTFQMFAPLLSPGLSGHSPAPVLLVAGGTRCPAHPRLQQQEAGGQAAPPHDLCLAVSAAQAVCGEATTHEAARVHKRHNTVVYMYITCISTRTECMQEHDCTLHVDEMCTFLR